MSVVSVTSQVILGLGVVVAVIPRLSTPFTTQPVVYPKAPMYWKGFTRSLPNCPQEARSFRLLNMLRGIKFSLLSTQPTDACGKKPYLVSGGKMGEPS